MLLCDNLHGSANGLDTVNALRAALARDVPAIVMTGDIRSKVVDQVAAHGISVLIKPFLADELLSILPGFTRDRIPAIQPAPGRTMIARAPAEICGVEPRQLHADQEDKGTLPWTSRSGIQTARCSPRVTALR